MTRSQQKPTFDVNGHGEGAGRPHIEVGDPRVGRPAPEAAPSGPADGRVGGRFTPGEAARNAGRAGGLARARKSQGRWAKLLRVEKIFTDLEHEEYFEGALKERQEWYLAQCAYVASSVGGGVCSPGVASILETASWERCFSTILFQAGTVRRFAWDIDHKRTPKTIPRTELLVVAARLGDSSRQNILAAHSLAAVEARSRAERVGPGDALPGFQVVTDEEPE